MSMVTIFRGSVFFLFVLGLIVGTQWLRVQHRHLTHLRQQNMRLIMQTEQLMGRLLQVKAQAATLTSALSEQQKTQQQLEEKNHAVRNKIGNALAKNHGVRESVSADVISRQREAISRASRS
ncbi:hypothetical protein ACQKDS_03365 [Serratia sp. NPDC078593]|uniref:hypothetical protein n=1 Tax=unclassified Serratia (in: enterobacteria) TaxID=2647522 RepID=UPI0037CED0A6